MTTVKTDLDPVAASRVPFTPRTATAASDVQAAIEKGGGGGDLAAHEAAADPHPQYTTAAEAAAAAAAAVSTHEAASDPHPGYTTAAEVATLSGILDFVRDFNGVGDDNTLNDTAYLAWVAACSSTGKPGFLPQGTFRISTAAASVTPPGAFMIFGTGAKSVIKRMNDVTAVALEIVSADGPVVRDLKFLYSNGTTTANSDHGALRFKSCTDPLDFNVTFQGGWYFGREDRDCTAAKSVVPRVKSGLKNRGIYTTANTLSRGTEIIAPDIDGGGVLSYGVNNNAYGTGVIENYAVTGGRIYNVVSHAVGVSDKSYNFAVTGVKIDVVTSAAGVGVLVQEANGSVPQDGVVSGCTVRSAWNGIVNKRGIRVAISGNNLSNINYIGISCAGAQEGTAADNNIQLSLPSGIAWAANTAYLAGAFVTQGSKLWVRNSSGTSRASFDATEQALHTEAAVGLNFVAESGNNVSSIRATNNRVRSNIGGTGMKSDSGSANLSFDDNELLGFTTEKSIGGSGHTYGEDLRLAAGANQTVTAQVTFSTSGIPVVVNSTNSAQAFWLQMAGVTTGFFGSGAAAPLFVQNPIGYNCVLFSDNTNGGAIAAYPQFAANATGGHVQFNAIGTDTDIDIIMGPKGAGKVRLAAYTAGAPTATGYLTVKGTDGVTYKLLAAT